METNDNKSKNTVLVAEDDYASRELLKSKLNEHKRKFIIVEDGKSAIDIVKSNSNVSLVFMDIRLPEIDGIEAMRKIKKLRKNIVVVAQTAYLYSLERDKELYLSFGFDDFIEKPFNMNLISEMIEKYS